MNNSGKRGDLGKSIVLRRVVEKSSGNGLMSHLRMSKFMTNRWSKCCVSTSYPEIESQSIFRGSENITPRSSSIMKIRCDDIARIDLNK